MKENIIIRRVDELGRFVLPKDIRKQMNIRTGDYLELSIDNDIIQMKKYSCIQELEHITEMIIGSVYDVYGVESILMEDENIVVKRIGLSEKTIIDFLENDDYKSISIEMEGNIVGKYVLFSKDDNLNKVHSFISVFLNKYLE
jgi:AbrB family transcriptional regulator (stage V sporulation protein T)